MATVVFNPYKSSHRKSSSCPPKPNPPEAPTAKVAFNPQIGKEVTTAAKKTLKFSLLKHFTSGKILHTPTQPTQPSQQTSTLPSEPSILGRKPSAPSLIQMAPKSSLFSSLKGAAKRPSSAAISRTHSREIEPPKGVKEEPAPTPVPAPAQEIDSKPKSPLIMKKQMLKMPQSNLSKETITAIKERMEAMKPTHKKAISVNSPKSTLLISPQLALKTTIESRLSPKSIPSFVESSMEHKYPVTRSPSSPPLTPLPTYYTKTLEHHITHPSKQPYSMKVLEHFQETYLSIRHVITLRKPSDDILAKSQHRCIPNEANRGVNKSRYC